MVMVGVSVKADRLVLVVEVMRKWDQVIIILSDLSCPANPPLRLALRDQTYSKQLRKW